MKNTRILLFLSPLVLFIPPLLPPWNRSVAWGIISFAFARVLRRFPWNLVMGLLAYSYAIGLGRDGFRWGMGAFAVPYVTPLILAFMPPNPGSVVAKYRQNTAPRRAVEKSATGSFEERFPLLERSLSKAPDMTRQEQRTRFGPVTSNFEFILTANGSAVDGLAAESITRKLTVWIDGQDDTGQVQVYGAGVVRPEDIEQATAWLRLHAASGTKLDIATRDLDGRLRFFEYHLA